MSLIVMKIVASNAKNPNGPKPGLIVFMQNINCMVKSELHVLFWV